MAGVRKVAAEGRIDPGATIVAVLTGQGLKDPDTAATLAAAPLEAEPSVEGVRRGARLVSARLRDALVGRSSASTCPATTANLGAGFDALALALDLAA